MQGSIKVTSAPCRGSAFLLTLQLPLPNTNVDHAADATCRIQARQLPRWTQHRPLPRMSWHSVIPANRKLLQLQLEPPGCSARALEGCLCVTPSDRCNTAPHRRQEHHSALITCMPDGPCCPRSSRGRSRASDRLWRMPDRALAARFRKHRPSARGQRVVAPGERRISSIAGSAAVAVGARLPPAVCARPGRWEHQQCSSASAQALHKVAIDRSRRRLPDTCIPALPFHHPCCRAGSPTPCKQEMPRLALQLTLPAASLAVRH